MTLAIMAICITIPAAAYIATGAEVRKAQRDYNERLAMIQRDGDKEFNDMLNAWTASKAA